MTKTGSFGSWVRAAVLCATVGCGLWTFADIPVVSSGDDSGTYDEV